MPIMNDSDDGDFMSQMQSLFGMDESAVSELLSKLTLEEMIDLAAAVTNKDREGAEAIIQSVAEIESEDDEPTSNEEQEETPEDEDDDVDNTQQPPTETPDNDSEVLFNVGDAVKVGDKEATIKIIKAPGNTVGVMIDGKLEMVDKSEISKLEESIMGITCLPNIQRMRELSGIVSEPASAVANNASVSNSRNIETAHQSFSCDSEQNPAQCCVEALDKLAESLPNVKLSDLREIRKRMNEIIMTMNESLNRAGKKVIAESLRGRVRK